ncbi:MAG: hypothetical protein WC346_22330 [Methanogenium sp.]|jgi:magnesium-transporting ATPase (P-type)
MEENKHEKIGFFEEEPNVWSHTRLMSTAVYFLLVGIDFWVLKWSYYSSHAYDSVFLWFMLGINFLFLVAIFYPKYLKQILEFGVSKFDQLKSSFSKTLPNKEEEQK